uniref:Unkown protein n=1 Tax=Riptortus pedestris TaxID=329032 RepID=R4WE38_RIPPE|nr:unkown protein [Riptortus pedestris]
MLPDIYKLSTGETLYISFMREIKNVRHLKKKIIKGEIQCCCITPTMILDALLIAVAADKAAIAHSRNKMITKNVYTEILYNLSPSKHITKSLKMFGGQDDDSDLIIAVIGDEERFRSVLAQVDGTEESLKELKNLADSKTIVKEYLVTSPEVDNTDLIKSLITRIAAKSVL